MSSDLNSLYTSHRGSGLDSQTFIKEVAGAVYGQPRRYGFKDEDEVGEAFALYWQRIIGVIERYEDQGSSFEAYLATTLRFIALSMRRQAARQKEVLQVLNAADRERCLSWPAPELVAKTTAAATVRSAMAAGCPAGQRRPIGRPRDQRVFCQRVLFLCVKTALQIADDEVLRIADRLGHDPLDLLGKVQQVRQQASRVQARRESRQQARNSSWVFIQLYHRQLARETDAYKRQHIQDRLVHFLHSRDLASRDLARLRLNVANTKIARLFGVSKATVDSGLERLRRSMGQPA